MFDEILRQEHHNSALRVHQKLLDALNKEVIVPALPEEVVIIEEVAPAIIEEIALIEEVAPVVIEEVVPIEEVAPVVVEEVVPVLIEEVALVEEVVITEVVAPPLFEDEDVAVARALAKYVTPNLPHLDQDDLEFLHADQESSNTNQIMSLENNNNNNSPYLSCK
jgi:hypothetical protein